MICATVSMYLIYAFMHFGHHVEETWFVRYYPFVNTLRGQPAPMPEIGGETTLRV